MDVAEFVHMVKAGYVMCKRHAECEMCPLSRFANGCTLAGMWENGEAEKIESVVMDWLEKEGLNGD